MHETAYWEDVEPIEPCITEKKSDQEKWINKYEIIIQLNNQREFNLL